MWFRDLQHAARVFRRHRAFTAIAVLTLALGVGGTTAMLALVDAILIRPLAYPEAERLVVIRESLAGRSRAYPSLPVNAAHFYRWRRETQSFAAMALVSPTQMALTGSGEPQQLGVIRGSASLLAMLGVQPALGRTFLDADEQPGRELAVILSDALWRSRFSADPTLVGRTIMLNAVPYLVVGVLPPSFRFPKREEIGAFVQLPERADVVIPYALDERTLSPSGNFNVSALARLAPGVTVAQAEAELNGVEQGIARALPEPVELHASVRVLQDQMVRDARRNLLLLLALVLVVLLIVCLNLAALLLVRGFARAREFAVRVALGATRAAVWRQLVVESLVVALVSGVAGLAIAWGSLRVLMARAPVDLPRLDEVRVGARVLAAGFVLSLLCGVAFALWPAWKAGRTDLHAALKSGGRTMSGGAIGRWSWRLLVAVEAGLSAVLVMTAVLLIASLSKLTHVDRGFSSDRVLAVDVVMSRPDYRDDGARRAAFCQRALAALEAVGGVDAFALVSSLPLRGESWADVVATDVDARPAIERPIANYRFISPRYFETLSIPLRRGRTLADADRGRAVAVVSERVAALLWPGQDAIGRRLRRGSDPAATPIEVVGIVPDIRAIGLRGDPGLIVYVPYWQQVPSSISFVLRTSGAPQTVAAAARAAIWSVDSAVPITAVRPLEALANEAVAPLRFQMLLSTVFAAGALLLATLGTYGVVSHSIASRTNEIGIRMALGAGRRDLSLMVFREGLMPVAGGLLGGAIVAVGTGGVLRSLLFGVEPADPRIIAGVVLVVLTASALACVGPAMRATRVDPSPALRAE